MWSWRTVPFLLLSLSLAVGIIIYQSAGQYSEVVLWILGIAALSLGFLVRHRAFKQVFTGLAFIIFMGLGYSLSYYADPQNRTDFFQHVSSEDDLTTLFTVQEIGMTSTGMSRLACRLIRCQEKSGVWVPCSGNLLLYVKNSEKEYEYGQTFKLTTRTQAIQKPKNPYSFDYKQYMERKYIYDQCFIEADQLQEISIFSGNSLIRFSKRFQQYCLQILDNHLDGMEQKAVAAALLLGEKSQLPDTIKEDYTATGATHVLAVSGLHTGIVAGSLLILLQFIRRNTFWVRLGKCLVALCVLWLFVMVTGMAPSVLRAATMFTFVLIGQLLVKRPTNIYNIIALSAFILMIIDPIIIYQVGFQLSYSALLGIVAFQQKIFRSVYIPNKYLSPVWNLMTVSIAAQLGTLPFTLYYFHMFPFYFWLSGIIVVPMAGVILKLGMVTITTQLIFPGLAYIPAKLLSISTWLMNQSIKICAQLPAVESEGLWISQYQAVLLGLCIILLGSGWNLYRKSMIRLALFFGLLLSISAAHQTWKKSHQQILTVYDVKGSSVFDYFDGKKCTCFTDADTESNAYRFATQQNRWAHGIRDCNIISLSEIWSKEEYESSSKAIQLNNDIKIRFASNNTTDSYDIYLQTSPEAPEALLQIIDGTSKNRFRKPEHHQGRIRQWYTAIDGAFQTK